jgi:hypothetical protein
VRRYGVSTTVHITTVTCLWYSVFGSRPVQVVLIRDTGRAHGFDPALVSTDLAASPAAIIERYAARWSIEVAIEDAKQLFGVGQARNRTAEAVRRTVPFGLFCQTLTILWYAQSGHHPDDAADHRARTPWYTTKTQPSVADMLAKLRRDLIATRFQQPHPDQPTPAEIHAIRLAWEIHAAYHESRDTSGPFETWRSNIFSVPAGGMPDGGLVTTAADLARLIDALLAGRLVSPSMLAAMTTPQGPPSTKLEPYAWGYGYGLELVVENGEVTIFGHGGADPGVSTIVAHHRATATTIVVLCNHDRGSWPVNFRLAAAFGLTDPRS